MDYGKFILRKGSRFVCANVGDGSEALHGGELTHQRLAFCQPAGAQRKSYRDQRRKCFRDSGYGKAHRK